MTYMSLSFFGFFILFSIAEAVSGRRSSRSNHGAQRIVVNFALHMLTALILTAVPVSLISFSVLVQENNWGIIPSHFQEWGPASLPIAVVATLLLRTFIVYWIHRLFHVVPALWRVHRVHHNDPVMDISVALRHHPIEVLLSLVVFMPFVVLFDISPEVLLTTELLITFGIFFEHADIVLPQRLSAFLSRYFSTPQIHEIHHASDQKLTDTNFSPLLMIWDHVFGTYQSPLAEQPRIGLGEEEDKLAASFVAQLGSPLRK